ncbi:MAG: hypothetical protein ACKPHU_36335 [Planctomycetaceae bacterium]
MWCFQGIFVFFGVIGGIGGIGEKNFSGMLAAEFPEVRGCGGILQL